MSNSPQTESLTPAGLKPCFKVMLDDGNITPEDIERLQLVRPLFDDVVNRFCEAQGFLPHVLFASTAIYNYLHTPVTTEIEFCGVFVLPDLTLKGFACYTRL